MSNNEPQPEPLTDEEKKRELDAANRIIFTRMGFKPDLFDSEIHFGSGSELSDKEQQKLAMAMSLRFALKAAADLALADIHTREDMKNAIEGLNVVAAGARVNARKILDQIREHIPRGAGPGRDPLLNEREASIACDQISKFNREGDSITKAIAKTSELSRELLGKDVAPRTLSNYWKRRQEFTETKTQKRLK